MKRSPHDIASTVAYLGAWRAVRALPERVAYQMFDFAAPHIVRRGGRGINRLRSNLAIVRPELNDDQLTALTIDAMRSYLRYWCDIFRLPDWSPDRITSTVREDPPGGLDAALARNKGVILVLGHIGNWDHAGAWVTVTGKPSVTTVAENLKPQAVLDAFLKFRTDLGMTIHILGDSGTYQSLSQTLDDGGLVALLADRDLTNTGMTVDLCGCKARVAAGPAKLAEDTGAELVFVPIRYERRADSPSGWGIVISFEPVPFSTASTYEERVVERTQNWVSLLEPHLRRFPQDWHMLQRVFIEKGTVSSS